MPTTTPLTDAIEALTRYANETTGASDTTLSDAVGTLVAGYGQGGGGEWTTDGIADGSEPSGALVINSSVADQAFRSRNAITSVSGNCSSVGADSFNACVYLTSVDFPEATTVKNGAFNGCGRLKTALLPKVTNKATYGFYNCQQLETVDLSSLTGVGSNYFQQCYALETLDLPSVTSIDNNAFYNTRSITTLILRHTSVVTLANVAAFTNTPLRGYGGKSATVYVPAALVSSYQTASNWSTLYSGGYCTFAAIEGSAYE